MSWWSIEVGAPAGRKEAVGAWLVAHTGHAVEERDGPTLVAFAPDERIAARVVEQLGRETDGWVTSGPTSMDEVDWSTRWREGLGIRRIGRLSIIPSWQASAANLGPWDIVLDPETAFGSGEHGSTRVALALMDRLLRAGTTVLDLGSGSGILTIAAVKLGAAHATGIEVDPDAIAVAERNAARNQVSDRLRFLEGDAAVLAPLLKPVDMVLSNILRVVNAALLPEISIALAGQGTAIFSGMELAEAAEFRSALSEGGFAIVEEVSDSGWWGVAAQPGR
jgi:ribosomal protein L11 methyltransferase